MSSRPPSRRNFSRPAFGPSRDPQPIPRVRVVLHRGHTTGLLVVAQAVKDLTRFGDAEATHRMWEVHHRGRADVLVTHLERAELYVEQFADRGLTASIEPA